MTLSASDVPAMFSLLENTVSGEESVRRSAEAALSQSESRPGFCSCLMEVVTSKNLVSHVDVRLIASIDTQLLIGDVLAVLVSKIARFDYPREWPELFPVLAQRLQSADVLTSHRIFVILFRSLKELSTKRHTADQKNFFEISLQLFDFSWNLWQTDVQTIRHGFSTMTQSYGSNGGGQHHDELFMICERWFLCMKVVCLLIISGFQSDAICLQEIRSVKEVSPVLLKAVQSLLPYYSSFQNHDTKFWEVMKKACIKLMKALVEIQNTHPHSFGDKSVLPVVMDFCLNKITDPEPELLSFEEYMIQYMVMVKCVLECKEYKPSIIGHVMDGNGVIQEQMKKNASTIVGCIVSSLLPHERIILLCNTLVRRYFGLTPSDLEEWYQNPESFHHEQDTIQWTKTLRPYAESLYIVLFENYSQLLGPVVVSILQEAMNSCPRSVTEITPALLLKVSLDPCGCFASFNWHNAAWFNGALSRELSNDHPNRRIIHRRVAIILGQWVSEIKDDMKRAVYCSLIRLLQDNDLAVKLAASRSLCLHVEDTNFSEQYFSDLLPLCWESCFNLVEEVQEFNSKVEVLDLISMLIAHVSEVVPYAHKLVQFFQKVWEESSCESLLQIELLIALRNFVVALGNQSQCCHSLLVPILQQGIDINSPDELNLLEDSMALWEATLSYTPMMVPQLLAYFPYMVAIIERSFDHFQVAVSIMESYIILGGEDFLNMHASSVARVLDLIVGNVNDKGLLLILPVIDILVQCFPVEAPPLVSSCLQKLVIICLSGGNDLNPSKTAVKASSAAILARILVMNTSYLAQLTSEPSLSVLLQRADVPIVENILLCLTDVWLDKVDHVSTKQKKTFGLALSVILTLTMPQVLDKLDQILSVCTGVILGGNNALTEEESRTYHIGWGEMSSSISERESSRRSQGEENLPSKELRKRQDSVRENLKTCSALRGEAFNAAISRMHPSAQVKQALKLP